MPRRDHSGSFEWGGRAEQGQGCCRRIILVVVEPETGCQKENRGCTRLMSFFYIFDMACWHDDMRQRPCLYAPMHMLWHHTISSESHSKLIHWARKRVCVLLLQRDNKEANEWRLFTMHIHSQRKQRKSKWMCEEWILSQSIKCWSDSNVKASECVRNESWVSP
jgi:hypothetical protein